jgi:predicted extracellular nuclease
MKKLFTIVFIFSAFLSVKAQSHVGQPCTDLFISEYVSPQGTGVSGNKTIEIYNPSSSAINLSGYLIKTYANGSCTAGTSQFHFPNKNLAAGGCVCN